MTNKINNIILYLLIVFSIYCALIIGLSWDNFFHMDLGNRRLKYLLTFGSFDNYSGGYADQKSHPGFYYTLVIFVTKMFPKEFEIQIIHAFKEPTEFKPNHYKVQTIQNQTIIKSKQLKIAYNSNNSNNS